MSLEVEKALVPDWFASPFGAEAHRKSFQTEISRKRFCSVDVNKTFEDEELRNFLLNVTAINKER